MTKNSSKDELTFEEKFNDYGEYKDVNDEEHIKIDSIESPSYQSYNYEEDNDNSIDDGTKELVTKLAKVIGLVILVIVIILLLLKACGPDKTNNGSELENKLIAAGKKYYEDFGTEIPSIKGTCKTVDLDILNQLEYTNSSDFSVCDSSQTYVKVCVLPNGNKHYLPVMECDGTANDTSFGAWKEGTESNLIVDKSDVKFEYKVQYLDGDNYQYGKEETLWQDEITYKNYKTISLTPYYKYRDKEYIWTLRQRYYYPGDKISATDVNTYYTKYPANNYINSTGKTTVYRWYNETNKEYYPVNEGYSKTQPSGYALHDDKENLAYVYYSTRTWNEVTKPTVTNSVKYYKCSNGTNLYYYSYYECSLNENPYYNDGYTTTVKVVYSCDNGITMTDTDELCTVCSSGSLRSDKKSCGSYTSWSAWTINDDFSPVCDVKKLDTCKTYTSIVYRWYKADRTYIGNPSPTGQSPYFKNSPLAGAIKDESSAVIGYKWYKLVDKGTTSDYYPTSPGTDAIKTTKYRWGEWTSYSTKVPTSNVGSREIQKRIKVTLKQILSENVSDWKDVESKYFTEEDLIKKLKDLGYKVNSLEDIDASGDLKLTIKLYHRDRI